MPLADMLATAIASVSAQSSQVLEYATTPEATNWTAIDGYFTEQARTFEYDERRGIEVERRNATLVTPLSATSLARGYYLRVDTGDIWSIRAGPHGVGQKIYDQVQIDVSVRTTPNRGRVD